MNKQPLLLLALLILSACAPQPTSEEAQDLYVEAVQARATSDAALQAAKFQEQYLTATAQAPIIHITETAAGLFLLQQYWTATAISIQATETAAMTSTAMAWTPTPNATSTAVFAAANAEATAMNLELRRAQTTNTARAVSWYVVGAVFLALAGALCYIMIRRFAVMPNPIDERGKAMPMIDVLEGTAWDIERSANGLIGKSKRYLTALPQVTAERQDAVVERSQMVDLETRRAKLPKRLVDTQSVRPLLNEPSGLFPLPVWEDVLAWNFDTDRFPLGKSDKGLEFWDVRNYAHLAIFGRSRAGKSRRSLRPLVTALLSSGQRVLLVGKEIDFLPFLGHPNVVFVPIYDVTSREEAMKYFAVMSAAVAEKNRRIRQMAGTGHSLWQGERTFLVFDELGNAIIEMPDDIGDDTLRKARSIVNEAGKAGLSLVFSAQRPKGFIDLTTQCGRVVFQVESDQEKGYALGYKGADKLPDVPTGYFYRKFGSVQLAGAFEPSDDQIRALLSHRPAQTLPAEEWIEGVVVEQNRLPRDSKPELPRREPETLGEWIATLGDKGLQVVEMYQRGQSQREIEKSVFGYSGGSAANKVADLIRKYRSFLGTTTATTTQNMPDLGLAAG